MFLVTGGLKEPDEWIRTTEVYDPNTESWRFVEDLPKALRKGFNKKWVISHLGKGPLP